MSKNARVNVYAEDAVYITAKLTDFDGDVSKWKNSVYELFRYDMTWGYAHRIDVRESRSNGVLVSMIVKPAFEEQLVETMESLGFRSVNVSHEDIGTIECTGLPDDMLLDYVMVAY